LGIKPEVDEMTRTTEEVIDELDSAVTDEDALCDLSKTALVVRFEHDCKMILHGDPDRLDKLNTMIENGGESIGFIKVAQKGPIVKVVSIPLVEFIDDDNVNVVLNELCEVLEKGLTTDVKET
jgi:hypothetical protein